MELMGTYLVVTFSSTNVSNSFHDPEFLM